MYNLLLNVFLCREYKKIYVIVAYIKKIYDVCTIKVFLLQNV